MRNFSNDEWLNGLLADDASTLEALRSNLKIGLRYALQDRIPNNKLCEFVEDFAQEASIRILDRLESFRGESRFITWATKIAVNLALSELRRLRWKDISLESVITSIGDDMDFTPSFLADPAPSPETKTTQSMMLDMVRRIILEELTEKQRKAMVAIMIAGMPIEEVAKRLGTNRNALYKVLHDARLRVRQRLEAEGLTPQEILSIFN